MQLEDWILLLSSLYACMSTILLVHHILLLSYLRLSYLVVFLIRLGKDRAATFPNPAVDFDAFLSAVEEANKEMVLSLSILTTCIFLYVCIYVSCVRTQAPVFDVRTGKDISWIDTKMLARLYGGWKCSCNMA